jgi:hypothetical protein
LGLTVGLGGGGLADAAGGYFPVFHLEKIILVLKVSLGDQC